MTSAEARAAAVTAVRSQQGLTGITPADWTYEQRTAYNKALAAYILNFPTGFTSADAGTAAQISATNYEPLTNASFSWGEFGDAFVDEAGKVSAGFKFSLGTGVALALATLVLLMFLKYSTDRRAS